MRWAEGALALPRWANVALAVGGVIIGAWWAADAPLEGATWWAAGSAIGLTVLANAYNDACDADIDRIAHPDRPIPSGAIEGRDAIIVAFAAGFAGVLMAWRARPELALLSLAVAALMIAYSRWIKRLGVAGNVVVAVLASLPFLYGAISVGRAARAIPLLALAVPLHFAREVAKDLEDVAGDRGQRATLPLTRGTRESRGIVLGASVVFAVVVLVTAWVWPTLILPGALAVLPAAVATSRSLRGQRGGPAMFKTAMVAALAGMVISLVP